MWSVVPYCLAPLPSFCMICPNGKINRDVKCQGDPRRGEVCISKMLMFSFLAGVGLTLAVAVGSVGGLCSDKLTLGPGGSHPHTHHHTASTPHNHYSHAEWVRVTRGDTLDLW